MITRRSMLLGLGATGIVLAAPAVIRTPGLLMPIKPRVVAPPQDRWWISYDLDGVRHEQPITHWHQDVDTLESAAPSGAQRIALHFQSADKVVNAMYG